MSVTQKREFQEGGGSGGGQPQRQDPFGGMGGGFGGDPFAQMRGGMGGFGGNDDFEDMKRQMQQQQMHRM